MVSFFRDTLHLIEKALIELNDMRFPLLSAVRNPPTGQRHTFQFKHWALDLLNSTYRTLLLTLLFGYISQLQTLIMKLPQTTPTRKLFLTYFLYFTPTWTVLKIRIHNLNSPMSRFRYVRQRMGLLKHSRCIIQLFLLHC